MKPTGDPFTLVDDPNLLSGVIAVSSTTSDDLRDALESVDALQTKEDIPQDEAIQLAILAELKGISRKLEDIEVHTNNTVRKL